MTQLVLLAEYQRQGRRVYFNRDELNLLLGIYSRKVAMGAWRDYAIDHRSHMAVFSIYRRSQERPVLSVTKVLLRGEKTPSYVLMAQARQIRSTRALLDIVRLLERRPALIG
jgi:Protein of unknown function (DUF2794)